MTEILQEQNFRSQKLKTLPIYNRYILFNQSKANSILECGKNLWFLLKEHIKTKEQKLKLSEMYTCKDRFCPFCNWRRELKYKKLIYTHLKALHAKKKLRYIFLTLTLKNCHIDDLKATVSTMNKAFNLMTKQKAFKSSILGYLRVLEYTVQKSDTNMLNPHFHCLLAVEPKYFTDDRYLTKNDFAQMWQKALRVDYSPVVHITIVKPNSKIQANDGTSAVAEMCKYPMKDADISKLSDENFQKLVTQLKNVRNFNAGGILKEILKTTEEIDDDLVHIDEEDKPTLWQEIAKVLYNWTDNNYTLKEFRLSKSPD